MAQTPTVHRSAAAGAPRSPVLRLAVPALLLLLPLGGCNPARGSTALAPHVHGPHDGLVAPFPGGDPCFAELKLHDDQGDLELWLGRDEAITRPLDLPLSATVEVEFTDRAGRKVVLRPRDTGQNPDESGRPNVRDGGTNYFVFPGDTGADAGWLAGAKFAATVVVRFTRDGTARASRPMRLAPHSHPPRP